MHLEWLAVEHYRMHVVEEWPDGPHKHAALAGIRSSLESLTRRHPEIGDPYCEVCSTSSLQDDTELAA